MDQSEIAGIVERPLRSDVGQEHSHQDRPHAVPAGRIAVDRLLQQLPRVGCFDAPRPAS
jgi:hypothetical protein